MLGFQFLRVVGVSVVVDSSRDSSVQCSDAVHVRRGRFLWRVGVDQVRGTSELGVSLRSTPDFPWEKLQVVDRTDSMRNVCWVALVP